MPTYQYSCTECGHFFEQFQSFSEESLTVCPQCQGRLRKVFNAVGVVFKGSGFYRTDSRTDGKAETRSSGSGSGDGGSGSSDGGSKPSSGSGGDKAASGGTGSGDSGGGTSSGGAKAPSGAASGSSSGSSTSAV